MTKKKNPLASVEMKIWRRTVEYTLFDHTRNDEILEEMKVEPIGEKLRRKKWIGYDM